MTAFPSTSQRRIPMSRLASSRRRDEDFEHHKSGLEVSEHCRDGSIYGSDQRLESPPSMGSDTRVPPAVMSCRTVSPPMPPAAPVTSTGLPLKSITALTRISPSLPRQARQPSGGPPPPRVASPRWWPRRIAQRGELPAECRFLVQGHRGVRRWRHRPLRSY